MVEFTCSANATGWGPTSSSLPLQFTNVPYASFSKTDRLGKAADFISATTSYRNRKGDISATNTEFQYKHDLNEDASFQLVDTVKAVKSKHSARLRPWSSRANTNMRPKLDRKAATSATANPHIKPKGTQQQNKRWDRLTNARRQYNTRRREEKTTDRNASVQVQKEWKLIEQFDLAQLTKLAMKVPDVTDLKWCGNLHTYDDTYDRITTRSGARLTRFDQREFFYVSTTDDPIIEDMVREKAANVFATDAILAHLMAAPRSVYPWDIVVERVGGNIFFDKREDSDFDLLTVNETAYDTPPSDDPNSINHPAKLSNEATCINQNFSQQILKGSDQKELEYPNPFKCEEVEAAAVAYRYRQWNLGGDTTLIARCEVNGVAKKRGEEEFITAYALNEWDSRISKGIDWRSKIDTQVRYPHTVLMRGWGMYPFCDCCCCFPMMSFYTLFLLYFTMLADN